MNIETLKTFSRDILALTKPPITLMAVLMAGMGMILAPDSKSANLVIFTIIGTALSVASAIVLNQYLERESDGLMERTKNRPLPTCRIYPLTALIWGLAMGAAALVLLYTFVNPLTSILALAALLIYTLLYTPLKKRTSFALFIGAISGAIPPLLGWTAITNSLRMPGVILFLLLFLWQIPHFIAIAIFYKDDYIKAGIRTLPQSHGIKLAKIEAAIYSAILIPISLALVPLGGAGWVYFSFVLIAGVILFFTALHGIRTTVTITWARQLFFTTLIYLPLLSVGLIFDMVTR